MIFKVLPTQSMILWPVNGVHVYIIAAFFTKMLILYLSVLFEKHDKFCVCVIFSLGFFGEVFWGFFVWLVLSWLWVFFSSNGNNKLGNLGGFLKIKNPCMVFCRGGLFLWVLHLRNWFCSFFFLPPRPLIRPLPSQHMFDHVQKRHHVLFVYVGGESPLQVWSLTE